MEAQAELIALFWIFLVLLAKVFRWTTNLKSYLLGLIEYQVMQG